MSDERNDFGIEEFEPDIVTLYDEDDNELQCEFIDYIEYEGKEYATLFPVGDEPEDESVVIIMEVERINDDEEKWDEVEDEGVRDAVYELLKQSYGDSFSFAD